MIYKTMQITYAKFESWLYTKYGHTSLIVPDALDWHRSSEYLTFFVLNLTFFVLNGYFETTTKMLINAPLGPILLAWINLNLSVDK